MKIYVFGVGCGAGKLMDSALEPSQVTAFVEERPRADLFLGRPVISPEELARRQVDLLIVTVRDAAGVAARCRELGIGAETLLFPKNSLVRQDRNSRCDAGEALLGRAYLARLRASQRLIRSPLWTEEELLPEEDLSGDYVRLKTLEAICRDLDEIPGDAAELGVYRGAFARCVNTLLPTRRLWLFDSFEGFDPEESAPFGQGFTEAHRNTSAEQVLALLPHPERAMLRPGLFPRSAEGLEELRFCLVSLDLDLEESTLAGLRWVWPRLSPGGFLLLHDYNNPRLPGVRAALRRYQRELGRALPAVPLCDICGSLILTKERTL